MSSAALRNIDLNLLVAFAALMRERNVSRAAKRLFIGQSGMSGMLARLRALFDDPLLVLVGRRLEPTPRALALAVDVDEALAIIERAIGSGRPFEPRASTRTFTIGLTDDYELLYAPALATALRREAPSARLIIRPVDVHTLRTALDDAELDGALSVAADLPSWHDALPLFDQDYRCIWSRQRLRVRRLTLHQFASTPHVIVTFRGDLTSRLDDLLAARGLRRAVVIGVSRFSTIPEVLATQAVLATVPAALAARFARDHGLATALPPIELPPQTVRLVYRRRDAALPELTWFRALVTRTLGARIDGDQDPSNQRFSAALSESGSWRPSRAGR